MNAEAKRIQERAVEAGIDVSLIESNLRLTISERLHRHDAALNRILKMRTAVKKWDERAN
jgi:beta-glucosidase-like glycosyl hydrolase